MRGRVVSVAMLLLLPLSCGDQGPRRTAPEPDTTPPVERPPDEQPPDEEPPPEPEIDYYDAFDPADQLNRASMVLRGIRPSVEDLEAVRTDPSLLPVLVDAYVDSPLFGQTIKDMGAEMFQVRADTLEPLPAKGPLTGRRLNEMYSGPAEAPLELMKYVVMEDRPLTELVTADYTLTNEVNAIAHGLPFDASPEAPEWQVSTFPDERPTAGILSDSEVWRRHQSAGSNFHRLRADLIATNLLCDAFATRDITVEGGVTLSDEAEVAEAVMTVPECISCHQALDPLAALFWGFKQRIPPFLISKAYDSQCGDDIDDWVGAQIGTIPHPPSHYCYPIRDYDVADEHFWQVWGLRPPGYYGQPADDLVELGQRIADDPSFSLCMARTFYGYLTQTEPLDVPLWLASDLQQTLIQNGYSGKELAKAVVLSESFQASRAIEEGPPAVAVGLQKIRPEQLDRMVADLTGFSWNVDGDHPECEDAWFEMGTGCWGPVNVMTSDFFGYRAMAGGITGYHIAEPTFTTTPPQQLVMRQLAAEASAFVVREDFALPPSSRRLLTLVEPEDTDEALVRAQIVSLHQRILVEFLEPDDEEITASLELWQSHIDRSGEPPGAWTLLITALLHAPRAVFF